ncbi:GFA family protein [Sessilibacter sp. MAH1]
MTKLQAYTMIKGSCLCGSVTFKVEGKFDNFFLCHCSYCKKDTGSAHAANLFTKSDSLIWLSGIEYVTNFSLESTRHVKSFCSQCGSAVPTVSPDAGVCVVPAGSLDDELDFMPEAHIFTKSNAKWEEKLSELKRFKALPK